MTNNDYQILKRCIDDAKTVKFNNPEHPLDECVVKMLEDLRDKLEGKGDEFEIYKFREKYIHPLWKMLIEKSIKCLRTCDKREPFEMYPDKKPIAYGIDKLKEYYDKYVVFEDILYGSDSYYRDHVVHVFRTWLSGVSVLVKNGGNNLKKIKLHEKNGIELTNHEKLSIWTIIALTHDLGYPLQKAKRIVDTTKSMISTFVSNPDISMDLSFHGVQNYMNDFIVRLMSSKMIKLEGKDKPYVARLQPKYYFKFQKSLEENQHGILSTLIIYKLLTYFLESDFNINEDYFFSEEDQRQFYIRREVLRAIASHTCNDVYQLYMASFSFLLRICDDTQEWGRKNISELYVKSPQRYETKDIDWQFENVDGKEYGVCEIKETFTLSEPDQIVSLINGLRKQSLTYVTVFRDGQDTVHRDFSFRRESTITNEEISITMLLEIPYNKASKLSGAIRYTSNGKINDDFNDLFFNKIDGCRDVVRKGAKNDDCNKSDEWRHGTFNILLSNEP